MATLMEVCVNPKPFEPFSRAYHKVVAYDVSRHVLMITAT